MEPFDPLGALPEPNSTTVLEASAGTGKTFTLAALVTRYIADGSAELDEMLLITFSRAATRGLRERVRGQLVEATEAFDTFECSGEVPADATELITMLLSGDTAQRERRSINLRRALADFDAATIATTHQFCHIVLKSLGVAGDTDPGVSLVDTLDGLVAEIVDDLYLAYFGQQKTAPPLSPADALELARDAVGNPGVHICPADAPAGTEAAIRVDFVKRVLAELEPRKRRLRIQGYDDLLSRLADALAPPDAAARTRMRQRWSIVMVDEFQDTDPVQWQVIERAFAGASTLILIGDPKQAIYAFRGGDIATYLSAARTAGERRTLATNWRSDAVLVESVHTVLRGAELGDADIVVRDVVAQHGGHRLVDAPHNAPFRLRVVRREQLGKQPDEWIPIGDLRAHISADLAADIAGLLASSANLDGEPINAGHIAVIVESHRDARVCRDALARNGISAVYTGDTDVFDSPAAADWLCLLEAMEQTHRPGMVRAAALTAFFGHTAEALATGGEVLTDRIAETLRQWADYARSHGVAAVFEAANLAGMAPRVLARSGGARLLTDLAHLADLLQQAGHAHNRSLPALAELLRGHQESTDTSGERNRRLDTEAAAVQIMTVWASKGLQFPLVYLPFSFNRYIPQRDRVLFHDDDGQRCLHIGGRRSPDFGAAANRAVAEAASEALRFTYVALTRAQSQVTAWWAASKDEINGGLSRLLRGRGIGEAQVPQWCTPGISDDDARQRFLDWQAAGGPTLEDSVIAPVPEVPADAVSAELSARHFHRSVDTTWRRTSYSALVRSAEDTGAGVGSEPEDGGKDDETDDIAVDIADSPGADVISPMAELPAGATFGSLVHAVLENADPFAADLHAELTLQVRRHEQWWPVDAEAADIAAALVPVFDTPLGPLADDRSLRHIGLPDRLRELDFEMPLAGGDQHRTPAALTLADVGDLFATHIPAADALSSYADRLRSPALGIATLRGYLSGSIDAVLRVPDTAAGHRYLVVDYKTNRLGDPGRIAVAADYGRSQMTSAMLHSDYPLQALLYVVVLHRFLRWRQPRYDPAVHLGGVLYLFLRGMCGPDTPVIDGHPAGVFGWSPPVELVLAVSDLLDGRPWR